MNQINFLPQSFVNQALRRRRKYRYMVMLAMCAVCLVGWGFAERGRNIRPKMRALALEAEVEIAREQMSEFVRLNNERQMLVQQNRIKEELSQPINHTQVVNRLARHLPSSIGLTDLTITTIRPAPKPLEKKVQSSSRSKSKRDDVDKPISDELQIEMDALAPDDLTIANLIGDLSEDALFDRVTLKYSRTADAQGVEGRLFKLLMRVRLDRRFEVEVAHAD